MSRIRRGSPLPGRLVLPAWAQDWPQQSVAGSRAALRRAASAPRSGPVQTSDERPQSCLQHGAIKPLLTAEMVSDRGLIDLRLGDNGADAGALVAIAREGARRRFDDLLPRRLRDSCHFRLPRHASIQIQTIV